MEADFVTSCASPSAFPRALVPEIALAGRSNVGKSSLINRISGHGRLARVSRNPGCTRTLNFYILSGKVMLVDLPGYGFARVSKGERSRWSGLISEYLEKRERLAGVAVVMDSSVPPSKLDIMMLDYLRELGIRHLPVATKVDRIAPSAMKAARKTFAAGIGVPEDGMVFFSAVTGEGVREVVRWISEASGAGRLQ